MCFAEQCRLPNPVQHPLYNLIYALKYALNLQLKTKLKRKHCFENQHYTTTTSIFALNFALNFALKSNRKIPDRNTPFCFAINPSLYPELRKQIVDLVSLLVIRKQIWQHIP